MLSYDFRKKVAIVTGGGSGMGRASAMRFATAGAQVMIADIDEVGSQKTVELIAKVGGEAAFLKTDVSSGSQVEALVAGTVDRFGRLDFGCNTAAITTETEGDTNDEEFDRIIAVNLRGIHLCIKHQVRQMQKQGSGGAIVNFSSLTALRSPSNYQDAYASAKAGVISLTRLAAMRHTREGIRVNTILPGAIDTPMLRDAMERRGTSVEEMAKNYSLTGKAGTPEEIAEAVMWLCSEYSSYVVGANLPVDGGALIG